MQMFGEFHDDNFEREENVEFCGENSIIFKIMLDIMNVESKKYLEIDYGKRILYILKQSNKSTERVIKLDNIA
jgi:hypothetical protein